MKLALEFGFNVIKNICLVIVVVMIIALLLILNNEETKDGIIKDLYNKEIVYDVSYNVSRNNVYREGNDNLEGKNKAIIFEVKMGKAYIRPSEIIFIQANPCIIYTAHGHEIQLDTKFSDLQNIYEPLAHQHFFKLESYLININYILQLHKEGTIIESNNNSGTASSGNKKYHYQHKAKLIDGNDINISKSKSSELFKLLDDLHF